MASESINPQVLQSLVSKSVEQLPVPLNGTWDGERGNSRFTLADDAKVTFWVQGQRHEMTGADVKSRMLQEYGIDSVRYNSDEPDFAPYVDEEIGSVEIDAFSVDRTSNYRNAYEAKASELDCDPAHIEHVMRERALMWHECGDRKTMDAVPMYIHAAFSHGGGIAVEKSLQAIHSILAKKSQNGFVLKGQEGTFHVAKKDLDRAVKGMKQGYRQEKRRLAEERRASRDEGYGASYITTRELAEERGVTVETVRRWCRSGKVPGAEKDSSGRWGIPAADSVG